jgi:excisionase family DNA binding protein
MRKNEYTTTEAAEALGLSHVAVRRAIMLGKLQATRRGRDNFITHAEVERYRREHLGKVGRPPKRTPAKPKAK